MLSKLIVFVLFVFVLFSSFVSAAELRFYGEEIIVTASRIPQGSAKSPWKVTVFKEDQIKTYSADTVADVVRWVPGVDIYSNGGRGAVTSGRIRGSTSQQVLVLVDGRRINSPLLGSVDLSDMMLSNVERIEIVSAPLSAVYGSDAIGGVINIITKKASKDNPVSLALSFGSYSSMGGKLSLANDDLLLIADYDKTDGFRDNSDYLGQNYFLTWNAECGGGNAELKANYYTADKGVPGVPNNEAQPISSSTPGNRQTDKNLDISMDYRKEFGPSEFSAKVCQYTTDQTCHQYNFITTLFEDTEYKTFQTTINLQNNLDLGSYDIYQKRFFTFGFDYRNDRGESPYAGNNQIDDYAAYLNAEASGDRLSLSLGLRYDQHTTAGASLNPRVGMSLALSDDLVARATFSSAYKAPTLNDLYWNDPVWMMYGDADLKPENALGGEFGLEKAFGQNSTLLLSMFLRRTTNLILWEYDAATYITRARNIGRVDVSGYEVDYKARIKENAGLFANATLQRAIDLEDTNPANVGKEVPFSPEVKANLGMDLKFPIGLFGIVAKHVGERYTNSSNTNKLDAYTVTDLKYSKNFERFDLSLKINNLFDTVYYEAVGFHPVTYATINYPMPGRNYSVGVKYTL